LQEHKLNFLVIASETEWSEALSW